MRTRDILTIVTPLLVGGSIVLALLSHVGADNIINTVFTPITHWWLGLPVVLGVPILFGELRKELSLLMIYQALGSFEVMLKTIGKRDAFFSIALSVGVALLISGVVRVLLEGVRWIQV